MGLAVYISLSALKPTPEAQADSLSSREPASFTAATHSVEKLVKEHERMATLQLNCATAQTSNPWQVTAPLVRLSGRGCVINAENTAVTNNTNGRVATVFPLEQDGFTTDYMDLSLGENNVLITTQNADGSQKITEVKIIRSK